MAEARVFDYEGAYKELEKEMGVEYVPGSLRELAMVRDWFEEPGKVDLYLLELGEEPSKERCNRGKEERAWNATTNEEVVIDLDVCRPLHGSGIPGVDEPDP